MASVNEAATTVDGHEKRRHRRHVSPPLTLHFEGHRYRTRDWSIGGFRLDAFHRPLKPGDTLQGSVKTLFGLASEDFEADVVRPIAEGGYGCRFLTLPRAVLGAAGRV